MIYARISQDREGAGLGIERQLADCRAEAERLGWTVAEEYVDDDVSAYSGTRRPAYERMLADVAERERDAIVVWHIDRLHRRPIELEELARTRAGAGLNDLHTVHGAFDLGMGDGLLVARLLTVVAANESDNKRRRGRCKMQESGGWPAAHGRTAPVRVRGRQGDSQPRRGPSRPRPDSPRPRRESLTSLGRWLSDNGITTVMGGEWRTPVIRQLLLRPRNYGVRTLRGQPVGPATWDPIITSEQGEGLRTLLTNPERRTNRTARRYLLSGMCRCHHCGTMMYSVPCFDERRYLCRSGHDFGGCGRMAISAAPLEQIIAEAVLVRLDSPTLHDAMAGRVQDDAKARKLSEQIAADTQQLEELTDLYTERAITAPEWK